MQWDAFSFHSRKSTQAGKLAGTLLAGLIVVRCNCSTSSLRLHKKEAVSGELWLEYCFDKQPELLDFADCVQRRRCSLLSPVLRRGSRAVRFDECTRSSGAPRLATVAAAAASLANFQRTARAAAHALILLGIGVARAAARLVAA